MVYPLGVHDVLGSLRFHVYPKGISRESDQGPNIHTIEANIIYHLTTIPQEQLTATLVLDSPAFADTTDVLINSTSPQLSGVQIESAMTEIARVRRSIDHTTTVLAKAQLMSALRERRTGSGLYLSQEI